MDYRYLYSNLYINVYLSNILHCQDFYEAEILAITNDVDTTTFYEWALEIFDSSQKGNFH